MHICAPMKLPASDHYALIGESPVTAHLAKLVRLMHPAAQISESELFRPSDTKTHLVLCGAHWARDRARMIKAQRSDQDYSVLPVPGGDFWSWWEFSLSVIDDLSFEDGFRLNKVDWDNYLTDGCHRAVRMPDGKLQLYTDGYAFLQPELIPAHEKQIGAVIARLSDDRSKQAYETILKSPPDYSWLHYLARVFSTTQYFDYVNYDACKTVLNGGVWLGFELPLMMAALPEDTVVHNLDPLGFDYLSAYCRPTVDYFADRCREHRVALENHVGRTSFPVMKDGQGAPGLSDAESQDLEMQGLEMQEFDCTTVDQFVRDHGFSKHGLIKFDLESGEENALQAMAKTIAQYRPQLAISVYHKFQHFRELPLAIIDLCPDYNFYFEFYSWERWEGIFYAIPAEIDQNTS